MTKPIGVLGGTFDPVHNGHLGLAEDIYRFCDLAEVRFIPVFIPPHRRPPEAEPEQRAAMLRLALAGREGLYLDERELHRRGVSYTVDTLGTLRDELAERPLCLVMGADAFSTLYTWKSWKQIPGLAHIIVVNRPGVDPNPGNEELDCFYREHNTSAPGDLHNSPAGRILTVELEERTVSSTGIRASIDDEELVRTMLPEAVLAYIKEEELYHQHKPVH